MSSPDEAVTNRKRLSGRSGLGAPYHKGGEGEAGIQDSNEYGERYEWVEKSNSTSTIRRTIFNSRHCITETIEETMRRLTKKGGDDFRRLRDVRLKCYVLNNLPESGEDADDEESTWSPGSPRPPSPPELEEADNDVSPTVSHSPESSHIVPNSSHSGDKCPSLTPTAQQDVMVRKMSLQEPMHLLRRKINKIQSLPNVEKSRLQYEPPQSRGDVHQKGAWASSYTLGGSSNAGVRSHQSGSPAHTLQATSHTGTKIKPLSVGDRSRCDGSTPIREASPRHQDDVETPRCEPARSPPRLQLNKSVVYEQGDEPSTTISLKGHVPPDVLDEIFFGRREFSCPCWPQYDDEHHIACMSLTEHSHGDVPARPAISERRRQIVSPTRPRQQPPNDHTSYRPAPDQHGPPYVDTGYRLAPDQRGHPTLLRLRSVPVVMMHPAGGSRLYRADSPAWRRSTAEAPRRASRSCNPCLISSRRDRALRPSKDTIPTKHSTSSSGHQLRGNKRIIILR